MAQLEVIALDTAVPQLRAPGGSDTYLMPKDLTIQGSATVDSGATFNGGAVFNETGADVDFRIESDTNANAFFLDGATGNVGIGTASAGTKLNVIGTGLFGTGTSAYFNPFTATTSALQSISTGANAGSVVSMEFSASGGAGPGFFAGRSASGTIGTQTAVTSGLNIGTFGAYGSDGTNFIQCAQIVAQAASTYTTNNCPTNLLFYTNGGAASTTERMRIDSSGNVGIGGTASAEVKVDLLGTYPSNAGFTQVLRAAGEIPSTTTTTCNAFLSSLTTQAASFTITNLRHFSASGATLGAGSAVTNQYGFFANSSLTGATNNYGFYSDIASAANRWNFYAAGTANNYFAGNVGIGTANPGDRLDVVGGNIRIASGNTVRWVDAGNVRASIEGNSSSNAIFSTAGSERMRITSTGNVVAGGSVALATTATDGFLYVPTCAGTPTGTPTAITGMAPIVVDTTNHKLYFYSGGTWRDAGP